ncbi:glycosyl hydrolase family 18 protein [Sulfobacillus harzensis]|uniref:GH18 domain-containing protein n=1 Tax=Sulfobacillus harzensis TaxID=2729629 RepID=A0A7Y0L4L3_9FIRM|nr:glycosyl hydrolase family 18 protein [Sulfobacillus harzensis]NMP23196.1 hypothetical protein [Sulfobacillus harzensis]
MRNTKKIAAVAAALFPFAGLAAPVSAYRVPTVEAFWIVGPQGHLNPGTTVTIGARGRASSGPVWYQFREATVHGWKTLRGYGPNNVLSLGRVTQPAEVVVTALTPQEVRLHQYWRARTAVDYLNVGSRVSLASPQGVLVGETVTITASAKNLLSPVYQLWYETPQGHWSAAGPYQFSPDLHWTPPSAGQYRLVVRAKDRTAPPTAVADRVAAAENVTVRPVMVGFGNYVQSAATPGTALYDLAQHGSEISIAAPLWYTLSPNDGTLSAAGAQSQAATVISQAKASGDQVWPVISASGDPGSGFDGGHAIEQLVQDAKASSYGGYVLDWEGLDTADHGYLRFVQALAGSLHQAGLRLMVTVMPENPAYPVASLAKSADYLDLLTYPEYRTTGSIAPNPGPTEGLPWVKTSLNALHGVPAHQVVLGMAPYGQSWIYTNAGFQSAGSVAITDRTIETALERQQGAAVFDPVEGELEISTGPLATVPAAPLDLNPTVFNPSVANLQFLLTTVLLRYDLAHHLTPGSPLATDGGYGPATQAAVAAFQKDYNVITTTPGIYDAATAAMLQQVVDSENIGDTVTWDENSVGPSPATTATSLLQSLATSQHLAGVSLWRLGYQAPGFWLTK